MATTRRKNDDLGDLTTDPGKPHYGRAYHCAGGSYGYDGGPRYRGVLWHGTSGRMIYETASSVEQLVGGKLEALQKLTDWCKKNGVAATIHWPDGPRQVHPGYRSGHGVAPGDDGGVKPAQETPQPEIAAPGGSDDGVDLPFAPVPHWV